jgi:hypothetical protein
MPNSAIYQGFVRPSVQPLMACGAVYPRISWMESWMKPASRLGAPAKPCVLKRPGVTSSTAAAASPHSANRRLAPGYDVTMVRTLDLHHWAGKWVAVDPDGHVHASADELSDVIAQAERMDIDDLEIMRAPVPGEPVVFGLG